MSHGTRLVESIALNESNHCLEIFCIPFPWLGVVYAGFNHENFICEIMFLSRIWQNCEIFNLRKFYAIQYNHDNRSWHCSLIGCAWRVKDFTLFRWSIFVPWSNSALAISTCPRSHALTREVLPSSSCMDTCLISSIITLKMKEFHTYNGVWLTLVPPTQY